jgi:hypothetical protein
MSFLSEIFGCSKRKHNKRTKKYRGGYTYKHSGSNDSGEDITASLSNSKSSRSRIKGHGVARGNKSKRHRKH